jgi:uncharacterized membrane protein YfcA
MPRAIVTLMDDQAILLLCILFFVVATLYTTVGHAGASGYLATMALLGMAPASMRPTALILNILVATLTVYRFRKARFFSWEGLWPFLLGSVPMAALGGMQSLAKGTYYAAVGSVLLFAATYIIWRACASPSTIEEHVIHVKKLPAMLMGAGIGFVSGLTGTGGGIFLSPLLLILAWAGPKTTAGISAPFIMVNSVVALAAGWHVTKALPAELPWLALSALCGALLGTWAGLQWLKQKALLITLAVVMTLAAAKLLLTA